MDHRRTAYTGQGNVIRPTDWQHEKRVQGVDLFRRRFIGEGDTPANALSWRTRSEKAKALDGWRIEVGMTFPESARVLRIAWALEAMFGSNKRYARVTDSGLSRKLGIPLKKIQASMTRLERSGLIVRASIARATPTLPRVVRCKRTHGRRGQRDCRSIQGHPPKTFRYLLATFSMCGTKRPDN
jgi:hypothetical protein